jgi:hypothetical protein
MLEGETFRVLMASHEILEYHKRFNKTRHSRQLHRKLLERDSTIKFTVWNGSRPFSGLTWLEGSTSPKGSLVADLECLEILRF